MTVEFCKGVLEPKPGQRIDACWARTRFGIFTIRPGCDAGLSAVDPANIVVSDLVTSVDLSGLDREHIGIVVENILRRGYLDKPGIRDKGDAVLFVLVNEALTEMAGVANLEDLDKVE